MPSSSWRPSLHECAVPVPVSAYRSYTAPFLQECVKSWANRKQHHKLLINYMTMGGFSEPSAIKEVDVPMEEALEGDSAGLLRVCLAPVAAHLLRGNVGRVLHLQERQQRLVELDLLDVPVLVLVEAVEDAPDALDVGDAQPVLLGDLAKVSLLRVGDQPLGQPCSRLRPQQELVKADAAVLVGVDGPLGPGPQQVIWDFVARGDAAAAAHEGPEVPNGYLPVLVCREVQEVLAFPPDLVHGQVVPPDHGDQDRELGLLARVRGRAADRVPRVREARALGPGQALGVRGRREDACRICPSAAPRYGIAGEGHAAVPGAATVWRSIRQDHRPVPGLGALARLARGLAVGALGPGLAAARARGARAAAAARGPRRELH
mmetsp:Transcript_70802/g.200586  ORF Transcript_70802/g.200586 Transcript_70802/m.200586 type:complete len:376 (+) Transcript_70802:1-1128(+)